MAKKIKIDNSDEVVVKYAEKDVFGNDIDISGIQQSMPTKRSDLSNDTTYRHNVQVYLANKIILRTSYVVSTTQSSSAATAPNSLGTLASILYYLGATGSTTAVPATGMVYINDNTTAMITGIYATSTSSSWLFLTYLPLVTSSGSDATIAVGVPSESSKTITSLGSPTVTAYVKAV